MNMEIMEKFLNVISEKIPPYKLNEIKIIYGIAAA